MQASVEPLLTTAGDVRVACHYGANRSGRGLLSVPTSPLGCQSSASPATSHELKSEAYVHGVSTRKVDDLTSSGDREVLGIDVGDSEDGAFWTAFSREYPPADLRRASATAMVAAGVDLRTAQERLGHADPRLTLSVYAHAVDGANRDAADRLATHFELAPPVDAPRRVRRAGRTPDPLQHRRVAKKNRSVSTGAPSSSSQSRFRADPLGPLAGYSRDELLAATASSCEQGL